MIDCNWEVTKTLTLPESLRSGVYAMRLRAGDGIGLGGEYIVFFVRPQAPTGRIAFIAPTASCLAYANEHLSFDAQIIQPMTGQPPIVSEIDVEMYKNWEFGPSTYNATEDCIAGGGRYTYMGGNGYYWNVAFREDEPWIMEVRKLDSGMRAWPARPGEHDLATTGQKSGLWKNLGRPPQKVVGIGFIAEGFETSQPYRRMPDSYHRTVSWTTEGVDGGIIGDFGLIYDGAAGLELDRYDLNLGTPPHTKIIAASGGHSDNYVLVTEELLYAYAGLTGSYDCRIRADMTYFTAPNNGAVFSAGSIAFGQALPATNFNNNVSRILRGRGFPQGRRLAGRALDFRGKAMEIAARPVRFVTRQADAR